MEEIAELLNGFKLKQDKNGFRLSVDSVILSDFITCSENSKILDIGTGNGAIPILLMAKGKAKEIVGVEIQREVADLALFNVQMNGLEKNIQIVNDNIKTYPVGNYYDVVVSNPPYMELDGKKLNLEDRKTVARHEVELNLQELVLNAKRVLKPRGEFFLVHRAFRVAEILKVLLDASFSVKKIKFAHYERGMDASLVLVCAVKGKQVSTIIEEPLYLKENGY